LHHVTEPRDGLGAIAAKVSKEKLVGDAVVEGVDNNLLGDGGAYVEEARYVPVYIETNRDEYLLE
jgi:hypothetical protein